MHSVILLCIRLQVEAELLPEGKDNPWGNAFVKKETDLVNESTSGRMVDPMKSRFWKIRNPTVCHEYSGALSRAGAPSALLHQHMGSKATALIASCSSWANQQAEVLADLTSESALLSVQWVVRRGR